MKVKKLISFVIPVYNEELTVPHLITTLTSFIKKQKKYEFEVILVENGSTDTSFSLLKKYAKKNKSLKIVQLAKNIGCDGGIEAGMQFARGDALVVVMADLQEPLEIVNKFIEKWEDGFEIVYGIVKKRTAGFIRNISSLIFYKLINILTRNMFPENASDFRLIDKKVYLTINSLTEKNKYLRGLIIWTGFKSIGIPFDRKNRIAGESKANTTTVLKVAVNGIFSFSYAPLRFVSFLGISITLISFIMMIGYIYLFFVHGREAPGVMTIIMLILFLFGLLFFSLGIISEYMARIYDEVKGRPSFLVKRLINTSQHS
ncbi:glycosyltransferase [Candidatus Roizmanbacteria bacterium CG03_land_8_20_14_0_80_39_12]|uniref:Glycosyltransferase n=1 Tax=Candidatus Roizmanbacteria bacterium CG03_land_8_20_14_0_80_39_12 TaxID=1974847 RepID=A0A2M7BQY3_9BACT|nr:MAG: glycosyltransferase [Candidatus Roizmanbacteria bacterium CG03_land_8_20_14_0_80_39_12]